MPSKESLLVHNKILSDNFRPRDTVSFMGGELFHRADIKELYEGFEDTIETIKKLSNMPKKIYIFSNLLYEDLSLIKWFIKKMTAESIYPLYYTSFDLDGRFKSNKQIDLFLKNLDEVENYTCIQFRIKSVITKQTLKNFDENSYVWKVFRDLHTKNNRKISLNKFKADNINDELITEYFDITNYSDKLLYDILDSLYIQYDLTVEDILDKRKRKKEETLELRTLIFNDNIYIYSSEYNK